MTKRKEFVFWKQDEKNCAALEKKIKCANELLCSWNTF